MTAKAYRGLGMEGFVASWYTENTGRDLSRFRRTAQAVADRVPAGRILEVAPGPGYLAIELAKRGYVVSTVDISRSFVRIASQNAASAGMAVDVRHGDAAAMPFGDASFDFIVCTAAFKNFSHPVRALDEIFRVLRPGGQASVYDLRKDASREQIDAEVRGMNLSPFNAWLTRWTFRLLLLKRAYTREALERMVGQSRFGRGEVVDDGIGFELRLRKGSGLTPSR